MFRLFLFLGSIIFLFAPSIAGAAVSDFQFSSLGNLASQLLEPVNIVSDFVGTASIIIGLFCFFAGMTRFMQYRVNPLASPISTVVVLFVLGIVLMGLPFMYKLTGYGIPFPSH